MSGAETIADMSWHQSVLLGYIYRSFTTLTYIVLAVDILISSILVLV